MEENKKDKKFFSFFYKIRDELKETYYSLSVAEKAFATVLAIFAVFFLVITIKSISDKFTDELPRSGGVVNEGVVGVPRFINPLLAISEADRDITAIVYSGLVKIDADGKVENDIADSFIKSEDGLEYTFKIKEGAIFHDGAPITAEDIAFTIKTAQNPDIKSPRRAMWEGVTVEVINTKTVKFKLAKIYEPFLENTTIGILPKHIWQAVSAQEFQFDAHNVNPIGSGPYYVNKIYFDKNGIPQKYTLNAFKKYTPFPPLIKKINVSFYQNEEDAVGALLRKEIDNLGAISGESAKKIEENGFTVIENTMPRIFGVFFNQNKNTALVDKNVRMALEESIDRTKIIEKALLGYGKEISSPLPFGILEEIISATTTPIEEQNATTSPISKTEKALKILEKSGWKLNQEGLLEKTEKKEKKNLSISIATANAPELKIVAESIKEDWVKIGINVDIKIFELNDLKTSIIRPREFEVLLFGQALGRNADLFAYWHSSQRNDPGLNIVSYVNKKTDKILEDIRKGTLTEEEKIEKYIAFEKEIKNDIPAVFLYSPNFLYAVSPKIKNIFINDINSAEERFQNIEHWYIETDKIWTALISK